MRVGQQGIVLELQRDCIDTNAPVSSILRKTRLIAVKLDLDTLQEWLTSELNGYECGLQDLPNYRKGVGQPMFKNPYRGWCPIMTDNGFIGQTIRTVHLSQSASELEQLLESGSGTLVMTYDPVIQEVIQKQLPTRMECGLHFSRSQITSALDFVRTKVLDWTLELEKQGILGEGMTFDAKQKKEAQSVTNNIYGGNIGVFGEVSGSAANTGFISGDSNISIGSIKVLADQIREVLPALPQKIQAELAESLIELDEATMTLNDGAKAISALASIKTILEGAAGNLAASGILTAIASLG